MIAVDQDPLGVQGQVINQGLITANSVSLVGQSVVNGGSIVAAPGTVALVAGDNVYLGQRSGGILVQISSNPASNLTPPPGAVGVNRQQAGRCEVGPGRVGKRDRGSRGGIPVVDRHR